MWGDGESWWLETKLGLNVILLNTAYKLKGLLQHVIAISALCICRLQRIRFNRGVKTTFQGLLIFLIIISKRVLYSFSEKCIHRFIYWPRWLEHQMYLGHRIQKKDLTVQIKFFLSQDFAILSFLQHPTFHFNGCSLVTKPQQRLPKTFCFINNLFFIVCCCLYVTYYLNSQWQNGKAVRETVVFCSFYWYAGILIIEHQCYFIAASNILFPHVLGYATCCRSGLSLCLACDLFSIHFL